MTHTQGTILAPSTSPVGNPIALSGSNVSIKLHPTSFKRGFHLQPHNHNHCTGKHLPYFTFQKPANTDNHQSRNILRFLSQRYHCKSPARHHCPPSASSFDALTFKSDNLHDTHPAFCLSTPKAIQLQSFSSSK